MPRFALALALLLLAAPAARAATVDVAFEDRYVGGSELRVAAAPGKADVVSVTGQPDGTVIVTDAGDALVPGGGCTAVGGASAVCRPTSRGPIRTVTVALGDRGDSLRAVTAPGRPWVRTQVTAGPGDDLVDLSGVRTTGPGDEFFSGAVQAGPGADLVRGTAGADDLAGGAGRDELRGLTGDDELDGDGGGTAGTRLDTPARDVLDGGSGQDAVSYVSHTRGVLVDLARGLGGSRGERDALVAIEDAVGSRAGDDLRGTAGTNELDGFRPEPFARRPTSGDRIAGGPGTDTLGGTRFADRLSGGAGPDDLDLGGGRDRYGCGTAADTVAVGADPLPLSADCETLDDGGYSFTRFRVAAGRRLLASLDPDFGTVCPETITLRARRGNALLGRTAWTDPPPGRLNVPLTRAGRALARKGGQVVVRAQNCDGRAAWILTWRGSASAGR